MKRNVFIGLITGLLMLIVNILISSAWHAVFPAVAAEYQNTQLFRPWSDPLMSLMFLHPVLSGVLLAWVYSKTASLFAPGAYRSLQFALIYWLFTLPGMIISYASFPLSFNLVLSWTVSGFLQSLCAAYFLGRVK